LLGKAVRVAQKELPGSTRNSNAFRSFHIPKEQYRTQASNYNKKVGNKRIVPKFGGTFITSPASPTQKQKETKTTTLKLVKKHCVKRPQITNRHQIVKGSGA